MFFQGWEGLWRTVAVGALAYIGLVLMLRISGKRTLAKLNSFDLVVTVSLGSTLATVLLNKEVALAEGLTAFALLITLQYSVTWLSVRSDFVRRAVRGEPRLLFYGGTFLPDAMKGERVTISEGLQAIRSQGILSLDEIHAVIMETDGTMAIIRQSDPSGRTSLERLVGDSNGAESDRGRS